jgi:hypothetical protein
MFRAVTSNSSTSSDLTKIQPSSSAKTTSLACTSNSPKRAPKRQFVARVEALRTRGPRAITENGKSDLSKLGSIAMCAPDHDPSQTGHLCFQRGQITNATFIHPSAIIDHQHVARLAVLHRFQEHIYAPKMLRREGVTGDSGARNHRLDAGRRNSERNLPTQRSVGNKRCRKFSKNGGARFFFHLSKKSRDRKKGN